MGELSIGFHLMSLLSLTGLVFWIVRLQVSLNVWRSWSCPEADRRVVVAEPVRALRQFACAVGCGFASAVPVDAVQPGKVALSELFNMNRRFGIDRIEVSAGSKVSVCFVLRQEPSTIAKEIEVITRELGGDINVGFAKAGNAPRTS